MLRFDAWQRGKAVSDVLHGLFPPGPRSVLDVGGGTGESLTLPEEWSVVSVDIRTAACEDFVCGSADNLPFFYKSFDIAVCLDTLEHLPENLRSRSITELCRIAREAIVLTAPFHQESVREAEKAVNDLYVKLHGKPHPWLSEHLKNPLPDLAATCAIFQANGWSVSKMPVGFLPIWTLLMLTDPVLESQAGRLETAEKLDRIYREEIYPADFCDPAYRTLIVVTKPPLEPLMPQPVVDPARRAKGTCRLLTELSTLWTSCIRPQSDEYQGSQEITARYVERLEQAIASWEVAYGEALALAEKGHRRIAELEQRRSFRLYEKVMRWLGREI